MCVQICFLSLLVFHERHFDIILFFSLFSFHFSLLFLMPFLFIRKNFHNFFLRIYLNNCCTCILSQSHIALHDVWRYESDFYNENTENAINFKMRMWKYTVSAGFHHIFVPFVLYNDNYTWTIAKTISLIPFHFETIHSNIQRFSC